MCAAGSGEEVSPDVIRYYNTLSSSRLSTIQKQGLSDQRVALINEILARRSAGASELNPKSKDVLKKFEEPRTIEEVRFRGQSFDPYIRDAQGNPIGTAAPPPGATPESIRYSYQQAALAAQQSNQRRSFAVGTGARGGVLVQTETPGETKEVFQSVPAREGGLPDISRERAIARETEQEKELRANLEQQYIEAGLSQKEASRATQASIIRRQTIAANTPENIITSEQNPSVDLTPFLSLGSGDIDFSLQQSQSNIASDITNESSQGVFNPINEFYYRSDYSPTGIKYYQTTREGGIIKEIPKEQVEFYGLTPTKELQATTTPLTTFQNIKNTKFYTNVRNVYGNIREKSGINYFNIQNKFPNERIATGYVPISPNAASVFSTASRVKVLGLSQNVENNVIRTQALFESTKKGMLFDTTERGIIKSITKIKDLEDFNLAKTAGTGSVIQRTRGNFYGGIITKPNKRFGSAEASLVKQQGNEFVSASLGKYAEKKNAQTLYQSLTYGKVKGQYTGSISLTESSLGKVRVGAIIKNVGYDSKDVVRSIQPSTSETLNIAKQRAIASTLKMIPPPTRNPSFSSVLTTATFAPKSPQISRTTSTRTQTVTQKIQSNNQPIKQNQIYVQLSQIKPAQRSSQKFSQASVLKSSQKTIQKTNQAQLTKQILNQKTSFRQAAVPQVTQATQQAQRTRQLLFQTQAPANQSYSRIATARPLYGFYSKIPRVRSIKTESYSYPVYLRRFGRFKIIGYGKSIRQAFDIGRQAAATTLGVTFKVGGTGQKQYRIPGFKTKKTKQGLIYIELPKYRLSTGTEIKEIQSYRQLKGGR